MENRLTDKNTALSDLKRMMRVGAQLEATRETTVVDFSINFIGSLRIYFEMLSEYLAFLASQNFEEYQKELQKGEKVFAASSQFAQTLWKEELKFSDKNYFEQTFRRLSEALKLCHYYNMIVSAERSASLSSLMLMEAKTDSQRALKEADFSDPQLELK